MAGCGGSKREEKETEPAGNGVQYILNQVQDQQEQNRLENESNVEIRLEPLPYEYIRWIDNADIDASKIMGTSDMKRVKDLKDRPLLLFINEWSIRMTMERNEGLVLTEFAR